MLTQWAFFNGVRVVGSVELVAWCNQTVASIHLLVCIIRSGQAEVALGAFLLVVPLIVAANGALQAKNCEIAELADVGKHS